jgi:hypothetical protein
MPNATIVTIESIAFTVNIIFRVLPEAALVFVVEVGACVEAIVGNGVTVVDNGVTVVDNGVEVAGGVKSATTELVLTAAGV